MGNRFLYCGCTSCHVLPDALTRENRDSAQTEFTSSSGCSITRASE
jgi:hypothetical protein